MGRRASGRAGDHQVDGAGYLNDEQYAASFAGSRLTARPLGRTRLRRDMQRKKLPPQVVENALDDAYTERDEEGLIDRAIDKRVRLKGKPSTREETKKLFDYLMRRGFQLRSGSAKSPAAQQRSRD
ncbi:MAG: RecX family transcriptional regulator [Acidobacteria bacterium]|nr:RecX family transcriptional regulator [Acidobacteriota bacterium]